jgi:hypothetical protein
MASLKAIVLAGLPTRQQTRSGDDALSICAAIRGSWEVSYSETGMLRLLWSLDLSHRKTRPASRRSSRPSDVRR